jgi:prophage regulatory protein
MTETAPRKMLSERQILDLLPIARSTLQQWEKSGDFPKSVMIGKNRKAWFEEDVVAWQKAKAA